jgi:DNA-binding NtrC family response regulator
LVIDDEQSICQNCLRILSKIECEVEYALNGYDALRMVEEEPFDVIITDLKMSSLGGMKVLSRVKAAYPDTMVIVITGYASVSSAVEVMKMGAFDYLPKPFTPDELRGVVSHREIYAQFLTNSLVTVPR